MTVVRYEPWSLVNRFHRDVDRLFGASQATAADSGAWLPPVDIHEEDNRFLIHVDLPGVDPKAVEITSEQGVLTLRSAGARTRSARSATATAASSASPASSSAASACRTRPTCRTSRRRRIMVCSKSQFRSSPRCSRSGSRSRPPEGVRRTVLRVKSQPRSDAGPDLTVRLRFDHREVLPSPHQSQQPQSMGALPKRRQRWPAARSSQRRNPKGSGRSFGQRKRKQWRLERPLQRELRPCAPVPCLRLPASSRA